jgi:hypothetical protein
VERDNQSVSEPHGLHELADYVDVLAESDEEWRLRIVLHDFGLLWQDTAVERRTQLFQTEPRSIDPRWDAFLAAYVEHRCWHDDIEPPSWVFQDSRYLTYFWYPATSSPTLRVEAVVHSPAAFEAHGVLLADRELVVV